MASKYGTRPYNVNIYSRTFVEVVPASTGYFEFAGSYEPDIKNAGPPVLRPAPSYFEFQGSYAPKFVQKPRMEGYFDFAGSAALKKAKVVFASDGYFEFDGAYTFKRKSKIAVAGSFELSGSVYVSYGWSASASAPSEWIIISGA